MGRLDIHVRGGVLPVVWWWSDGEIGYTCAK